MDIFSGLDQYMNVIPKRQIPEPEKKIEHKRDQRKTQSEQEAEPKFVQSKVHNKLRS